MKKNVLAFGVSFLFLNIAAGINIFVMNLFFAFDFHPTFLVSNFQPQTLINLYIFLALAANIATLHLLKIENIFIRITEIALSMLFFVWYCDILFLEILNSLFMELSENKELIKLQ